jgi:hypothetical protein
VLLKQCGSDCEAFLAKTADEEGRESCCASQMAFERDGAWADEMSWTDFLLGVEGWTSAQSFHDMSSLPPYSQVPPPSLLADLPYQFFPPRQTLPPSKFPCDSGSYTGVRRTSTLIFLAWHSPTCPRE